MKKKMTAMLLAVAMMLGMFTFPAYATNQKFNDVPDSHWAHSYIQSAAADGVMNGTGEGNFSPSKTLTRAEFIVMMMRAFYKDEVAAKETELKNAGIETSWYVAHCFLAYEKGLLESASMETAIRNGVGKLENPDSLLYRNAKDLSEVSAENITRIDMAVIAGRIMLEKGIPELPDAERRATLNKVPDVDQILNTQRETMAMVYYYKVITGIDSNGTFNPSGTVDRASAAAIYCRLRDAIRDYAGDTTPAPTPTPTPTPSVEPTPTPSTPPAVTGGTKAPYATTDDSIVGTVSDTRVTLSLETHKAPVDYWGKHPELNGLVDKDEYNAYVFMALNREWISKNGIVASTWQNGAWTDGVDTFNYPCFSMKCDHPLPMELPFTDYYVDAVTGGDIHVNRVGDTVGGDIGIYRVYKATTVDEAYNGNLVPIFAKFTPSMSDKDKIVIMAEALCEKMTYNDRSPEVADIPRVGGPDVWASDAPVVKGICDDYAVAFAYMCRYAGIPCRVCGGNNHAWNLVYADSEWYVVDVTDLDGMIDFGLAFEDARKQPDFYIFHTQDGYANIGFKDDQTNEKLIIEALYQDVFGK